METWAANVQQSLHLVKWPPPVATFHCGHSGKEQLLRKRKRKKPLIEPESISE